jgi:AcrR family transcriptional regulator
VSTCGPRKSGYHHGDLREALLAAALAMLEEGADPTALSLREAARRAGVSAMAPYRHFADKDALLAAVATIGFERLAQALLDGEHGKSGRAALNAQGVAYVAFACSHPALFRLMFGSNAPVRTHDLARASDASYKVLADRIAETEDAAAIDKDRIEDRALANWALVHGLAMLAVDGQLGRFGGDPVAWARRITAYATSGLATGDPA